MIISARIAVRLTLTDEKVEPDWYLAALRLVPGVAKSAAARVRSRVNV